MVTASGGGAVSVSAGATSNASVTYVALPGNGKLWVTDRGGAITGTSTVADGSNTHCRPVALALDDSGDLWVTSYGGSGGPDVLEYAAADIATTGSPSPAVVLTGFAGFNWPQLAFDPAPSLH